MLLTTKVFATCLPISSKKNYNSSDIPNNLLLGHTASNGAIDFGSLSFSKPEVLNSLAIIDTSKGMGPDFIPPLFLKHCADSLSAPLCLIFNKSLSSGIFPSRWKISTLD